MPPMIVFRSDRDLHTVVVDFKEGRNKPLG
jgi:hypothetical protein